jgi:hypothetical protein
VLSLYTASTCLHLTAYTRPVTFGQALASIVGTRKAVQIARIALGPDLPEDDYINWANYFSRITKDKVPNVGFGRLIMIAKGLGYSTLSSFFARVELEMGKDRLINSSQTVQDASVSHVAAQAAEAPSHGDRSVPADAYSQEVFTAEELLHFFRLFKAARGGTIAGRVSTRKPTRKQTPDHRPRKSKGR